LRHVYTVTHVIDDGLSLPFSLSFPLIELTCRTRYTIGIKIAAASRKRRISPGWHVLAWHADAGGCRRMRVAKDTRHVLETTIVAMHSLNREYTRARDF